jgi:hypothetical protein
VRRTCGTLTAFELMGFSPDCELWTVTQITKCCDAALYANVPTFLFQAATL